MSDKPAIPRSPSAETVRLNPHLFGGAPSPASATVPPAARKKPTGVRQRKGPNATEARFLAHLDAMREAGHGYAGKIVREGITLRWPDGMTYTPDVVVWGEFMVTLIEIKGPFIRRTGLEKFRAARDAWRSFRFELWQWKDRNWTQLL